MARTLTARYITMPEQTSTNGRSTAPLAMLASSCLCEARTTRLDRGLLISTRVGSESAMLP